MEKIDCKKERVNYENDKLFKIDIENGCDIEFIKEKNIKEICFILTAKSPEDDYLWLTFRLDDLLEIIGKAIQRTEN